MSDRLKAAIKCINLDDAGHPWLDDTQVNAAVSQLERLTAQRLMEANQAATELLLKGTTVLGQDGKQHTVHFIDFEHPQNNDFLAINQYRVDPPWATGNRGFIVPDIVLLVNGIPLVIIECKSPKLDNPITEAIRDLLQYSNQRGSSQPEGAEKLFHYKKWTEKSQQETHIERFKKPLDQDSLAILTVKSMLLTGFDAPLEQVLYNAGEGGS